MAGKELGKYLPFDHPDVTDEQRAKRLKSREYTARRRAKLTSEQRSVENKKTRQAWQARRAERGLTSYRPEKYRRLRDEVFEILGGARCIECGCDVRELLEVNHIEADGAHERKQLGKQPLSLYQDIRAARVDKMRYNVLCKVCNALHFVQTVRGIQGHRVVWDGAFRPV
jgi:hypothetical protein